MKPVSLIFCLFATFGCTNPLFSQLSFGIKGGINVSEFDFKSDLTTNPAEIDSKTGYTLGAVLEIGLTENIYLQPEAMFIQKGSELSILNEDNQVNLNYLDIPILLKIKLINANLFNLNLLGGPTFGFALNGETEQNGQTVDIRLGDDYKRFDLGLTGGGGIGINLGSIGVFGDVRYLFGVNNIDEVEDTEIKNKGLNFSVGLMFRLLGK